jgi:hypothetical protein
MIPSSEKQQQIESSTDELRLDLLHDFISLIKNHFNSTENYESQMTMTITTEELSQKVKLASGNFYDTQAINEAMKKQGFQMVFISVDHTPDYYWLMNPKI